MGSKDRGEAGEGEDEDSNGETHLVELQVREREEPQSVSQG